MKNFINDFKQYLITDQKSHNTIKAYIADIRQLFTFTEETNLENLNINEVQSFLNYLKDDLDSSNRTLQRKLNSISCFFGWLIFKGIHKNNPLKELSYPKKRLSIPKFLSNDEVQKLTEIAKTDLQAYVVIQTFLNTGIKLNELLDLTRYSLFFDKMNGVMKLADREIELNDQILFILKAYLSEVSATDKFLFSNSKSNQYDARNLRRKLEKYFKLSGLENYNINDLRNTFIVNQLKNNVDVDELSKILGNKSTAATERYLICLKD